MFRMLMLLMALDAGATELRPDASELATRIAERPANEGRVGTMNFVLSNAAGAKRLRQALMVHTEDPRTTRVGIFFTSPAMIADTAFLSFNHTTADDENWLFLPATERTRRLPASERGDYFLGTDLTYGDIKDNFKFALTDWHFDSDVESPHAGRHYPVLKGRARDDSIADELGYSAFRALVDTNTWFPVLVEYWDEYGEPLKRVEVTELAEIGGAWTAMRFVVTQLQSGHRTEVFFTDMRHVPALDRSVLDPANLNYGVPRID